MINQELEIGCLSHFQYQP